MEHVVMVVPKYADVREAERIGEERGQTGSERGKSGALGHLHFQHHDGNDDGNHSVRERLKPLLTHLRPLSFGFAAVGRQADAINGLHELNSSSRYRESVQQ